MFGEGYLIFNWHNSRAASEISFFREPTKDDDYSINIISVIICDTWYDGGGNLKRQIKSPTFWVELSSRKNDLS